MSNLRSVLAAAVKGGLGGQLDTVEALIREHGRERVRDVLRELRAATPVKPVKRATSVKKR